MPQHCPLELSLRVAHNALMFGARRKAALLAARSAWHALVAKESGSFALVLPCMTVHRTAR